MNDKEMSESIVCTLKPVEVYYPNGSKTTKICEFETFSMSECIETYKHINAKRAIDGCFSLSNEENAKLAEAIANDPTQDLMAPGFPFDLVLVTTEENRRTITWVDGIKFIQSTKFIQDSNSKGCIVYSFLALNFVTKPASNPLSLSRLDYDSA